MKGSRHLAASVGTVLASSISCSLAIPMSSSDPFPVVRMEGKPPVYELRNGHWFDGRTFERRTRYTVYGAVTDRMPVPVDSIIDLNGGYVVPAFGEAHKHNAVPSDTGVANRYLRAGIFYVKNPNSFPRDREAAKGTFHIPTSIDVSFSNGGLTGPGGHPYDLVRRNIARGIWGADFGEGSFYHTIASRAGFDSDAPPARP